MAMNRRMLLGAGVLAPIAASAAAQPAPVAPPASPPEVTRTLARYLVQARYEDLPANVRKEGVRTLLNWVGCAVGGSRHEAVDRAVAALGPFAGKPEANVLGRRERFDIVTTALLNGVSSHVFDYDDTHLKTIIHPAGPVVPAMLALAQRRPVSGTEFLNALVLGVETECRIGNAVYPNHYEAGWHITGSVGMFGAAAACGKLLGLTEQQMVWALGIAASQPVGLKIQFGSMTKSFHPGRAAQNGLTAALLAAQGYDSAEAVLEGKDGWGQAVSTKRDWTEVVEGLGTRYEAALNTYKPFACGIVTHPGIDAAIQLRNERRVAPDQIEALELHANPLVLSLTGKTDPQSGLEGKFSIYHCIAVGLIHGAAGERQFSDAVVRDPVIVALRRRVSVRTDPAVKTQQSTLTARLKDGQRLSVHVENAVGSLERPMTDAQLEAKFADLADGVIGKDRVRRLMDQCWNVEKLTSAGRIATAAAA
ncbi:MAG: MmgE/PrpD family protein [Caulobacteraceae bacterium]